MTVANVAVPAGKQPAGTENWCYVTFYALRCVRELESALRGPRSEL